MAKRMVQPVSATQNWRQRMLSARATLKALEIGQQEVLIWITAKCSEVDHLTFATRWRNAWNCKNADPEFTDLVEQATEHFSEVKDL